VDDPLDLELQLCFPLYAATRAVTRAYAPLLEDAGLTYPQYLVMLALWGSEHELTVGELGERLRLDSGTLTPVLKRLEALDLVARRRDPEDERRVRVGLTTAGKRLRRKVQDVPGRLYESVGLTARESETLRRLLARVIGNLDLNRP
jgi:MarR family transcriptional regulator, organic hydroperoxide resistance regulator